MSDYLAGLFGTAAGLLSSSPGRALELFTEITEVDESACDAWVGRIRCGDGDRATLFRAWFSRGNFGRLAGAAELSMAAVGARIPIGGQFGDITYPVTSPLAVTIGFAVNEASLGHCADAWEAVEGVAVGGGAEHLVAWAKAVILAAGARWPEVIDEVAGAPEWPDRFLAAAAGVAHGVAAARLGLFNEAERRLTESNSSVAGQACAPAIAWYLAMARRAQGDEQGAVVLLEWLQATHPGPQVAAARTDPGYRLATVTPESIAARADVWDPGSVVADTSGREALLAAAQAVLDRQIGLGRVKEQVQAYRAATQMARVRAARGMKVVQGSRHMIFTGPPGTGKTTIARVVADILAGLGVIAEPKLVEASRQDFVAEFEGQSAVKTARTIDRALGGVLFIDEAYTLVQARDGRADPFGTEAVDTLLARMENDRDRLVVIIAGYRADIDRLLDSNDGLRSRFGTRIEFEGYSPQEIAAIAGVVAGGHDSTLGKQASEQIVQAAQLLGGQQLRGKPALDIAGHGRYARQLVEAGEQFRDMRLARMDDLDSVEDEVLREIDGADMAAAISAVHARLNIGG